MIFLVNIRKLWLTSLFYFEKEKTTFVFCIDTYSSLLYRRLTISTPGLYIFRCCLFFFTLFLFRFGSHPPLSTFDFHSYSFFSTITSFTFYLASPSFKQTARKSSNRKPSRQQLAIKPVWKSVLVADEIINFCCR